MTILILSIWSLRTWGIRGKDVEKRIRICKRIVLIDALWSQPILAFRVTEYCNNNRKYKKIHNMLSIPEIATQLIDKTLTNVNEINSRTIFLVGSKSVRGGTHIFPLWKRLTFKRLILTKSGFRNLNVFFKDLSIDTHHGYGKTTLLYSFLEKNDPPRETLVVEYSFGRKSNQKQGIDKTLCHIWEYGGKLETLNNVLQSTPISGKFFFCIMVDLSKIKNIWEILETCTQVMNDVYSTTQNSPELIIICGKYDLFKNYDSEIKKFICTTLRSFALLNHAHLMFYSSKEPQLLRRAKDMLFNIGFGNCIPIKERNTNYTKPLLIPKDSDNWESIGIPTSTIDQFEKHYNAFEEFTVTDISQQRIHCRIMEEAWVSSNRNISIPDCVEFKITTNACRGFCESWSLPSIMLGFKRHPVTSLGQCCNIMESEDVPVKVLCLDGERNLIFKSAVTCACYHCQKE
ncbi:hypothetical protein SFRURICE_019787 [Spodoptera frugiperda]|nr:hypothetical protein SFRURICE_019787 [Spodoptera frugiperda]